MKANELMEKLFSMSKVDFSGRDTCDTLKAGEADKELKKVAVCCIATVEVIKRAHAWGADLLITHEPTFYDHMDNKIENDPVIKAKEELLLKTGMTLYRFHDHPHSMEPDMIGAGELHYLELEGDYRKGDYFGSNKFICHEPITPKKLAKRIEDKLGVKHVRICGATDVPCTRIATCFGTPGGVFEELRNPNIDIVLVGEACEWMLGEYARDAAQLGMKKALLIIGHMGSERDGMRYCARYMQDNFSEFETKYFDCGEVYTYTK